MPAHFHIMIFMALVEQSRKNLSTINALYCCCFGQFMVHILLLLTGLQRRASGLPTKVISLLQHEHPLPRHEIDLGLQAQC